MEFSQELIAKANKAKTVEELLSIAKSEGFNITLDDAKKYFNALNAKEGELADAELSNVSGGTCYSSGVWGPNGYQKYAIVTVANSCRGFSSAVYTTKDCFHCGYSFALMPTLYCSARTKDNDPYK